MNNLNYNLYSLHFSLNISKIKTILFTILLSCFAWADPTPKLELYKNASPQYIEDNRTISYIITIVNGTNSDGNYTIHDNMGGNGDFDSINTTLDENSTFSCTFDANRSEPLVCNGNVVKGAAAHIIYNVLSPNEGQQITNTVRITEDDSNTTINTASVTVTILPNYDDDDFIYNRDLCYIPPTPDEVKQCLDSRNFLYGDDCLSEITITQTTDRNLTNVHIFKSYSSPIQTDACYTLPSGGCETNDTLSNLLHKDSSSYFENAFDGVLDFSLGNMSEDQNRTIVDHNTSSVGVTEFNYIALIGQYGLKDSNETIEEYIYSCNGSSGSLILQDSSGGANDVNLLNNTFTAEDNSVAIAIPYNEYDKVGTKIVNQPFLLNINYLDENKDPVDFNCAVEDKDNPKTVPATIEVSWETYNSNGTVEDSDVLWTGVLEEDGDDLPDSIITYKKYSNDATNSLPYPTIDRAFKEGVIVVKLVDYPKFFANLESNSPCVKNSSFTGNLCNVPSCFDSAQQIFNVFPIETYPLVATCIYGDGGGAAPCDSNAYNGNCGGVKTPISPSEYNYYDGCARCLADAVAPKDYSNAFSVRPYSYEFSVPNAEIGESNEPVYQAGKEYPIDLNATTADTSIPTSDGYNPTLTGHNPPSVIASISLNTNIAPVACPYIDKEPQTIRFSEGYAGTPVTEANISYSNVGDVNLTIMDQNWTKVDWDGVSGDPECILDSNETDPTQDKQGRGRVGCRLITSKLMRFVPSRFDIDANLTNANTDANFTYLNDFNGTDEIPDMAASLDIDITAVNADGNRTSNYIDGCYAKDNNLSLTFDPFSITPTDNITHMLYYDVIDNDNNSSDHLLPSPQTNIISLPEPLQNVREGFLPGGNGTAIFEHKLNFNRQVDEVVQAFAMNLTYVNMTDTDNVEGNQTGITGQTAFMHYAKARPSVGIGNTYETVNPEVVTPILIHVYCKKPLDGGTFSLDFPNCTDLSLAATSDAGADWWLSAGHNANTDGNITLKEIEPTDIEEGAGTPSLSYTIIAANNGKDDDLEVVRGPNPTFPLTVNIELDDTSDEWLIHNPFNIPVFPSPFYKVKFISPSIWVGVGGTGSVVDTDVNTNTNKRMNW